ncbi:MAG TPA: NADH-quinone oxidoreductase subunit NuoG [Solirubrobacterales bacterium]|jgi:NADH-quinone oxidoreductase subunit G|nr:NADH-quinone oxidoreductase subunit NuoG [Solirubrobacterales bacterium]
MSAEAREVTLTIDGREVTASEGEMLHDAARKGDVEIPYFCYEPKLGDPVGACRMCLVEIEGIPKLQTSCSTPVRDGMVVHTRTEQVKHAQSAVVEFLLVNHPLDCPVCDKGGECPLQDITLGWGPGKSRVIDDKRHFQKPIELSPLVAIDRERCILCYRCVRFSQEISEDDQLQLLERGDRTFVGTFDDRPYVAPFHGNITDICPVGALTNYTYRFRARPWDVEEAGSVCTICPSQCNVSFTVRDEQVKRVLTRDNAEVDDGWICDRGRYGFEMFDAEERVVGPQLKGGAAAGWEQAIEAAAAGLHRAGGASAAIVGDASNEEGYLVQRLLREALGSPHIDSRPSRGPGREALVRLAQPELSVKVRDIDDADVILVLGTDPLHSSPILDLRVRKAIRRNGARLAVATERPTALDGGAEAIARYAPGAATHFLAELAVALGSDIDNIASPLAETLRGAGKVVVLWGERIARDGAAELLALAAALDVAATNGAGLLEIPDTTNARGLREAGCLPDAGPGLGETSDASVTAGMTNASLVGKSTEEIRAALESGELKGLVLFGVDPLRDFPDSKAWEAALTAADFVVCFSMHENATTAKADVVFPLETHAEKDGTVTHPDGRLQRVRPSASRPGDIRPNFQILSELSTALGHDPGIDSQPKAFAALAQAVPFYSGITDSDIGGRGIRWQDTPAVANVPRASAGAPSSLGTSSKGRGTADASGALPSSSAKRSEGAPALALGTYRDLWAGPITELNPPLKFLQPQQRAELSPADAERLNLKHGDTVEVGSNGTGVLARVAIRERQQDGVVFLIEGTAEDNANGLLNGGPVEVELTKVSEVRA